jgi:aspartyl/asparaginyl-tRNA synthetase
MFDPDEMVRIMDVKEALVGLRKDGIVHVYYRPHTEINIELQDKMLAIFNEITQGNKMPFLFEAGEFCTVTKEARLNAIHMEDRTPTFATAVLVRNLAQKMIADFYYKVNRPRQPFKVVHQKEKGIAWLKSVALKKA